MDKISIIIPIYNVEKYLERCINSIINQTYSNIEILLIDDGSTDSSPTICDNYQKKDNRIKVIHKQNGGLSDARNKGIEIATGEYLIFIDSDDYIEKNMVEVLYNDLIKNNADISICDYIKEYSDKKEIDNFDKKYFVISGNDKYNYLYNEYSIRTIVAWNKIYKKELFKEIRYEKGKVHEDEFIIHELLNKAKKISYVLEPLYHYIQRDNSITHSFNYKRFDKIEALDQRADFFQKNNMNNLYYETNRNIINSIASLNKKAKKYEKEYKNTNYYKNNIEKLKETSKIMLNNKKLKVKTRIKCIFCSLFPKLFLDIK